MNSGSDIAKEASLVILLNSDFVSITEGVKEGRLVFQNLQKILAYILSAGTFAELIPVLVSFIVGIPQPLSAFLMIIVSCLTDVYAGIALIMEDAEMNIMNLPPRNPALQHLVSVNLLLYTYLFYGLMETISAFFLYFHYMYLEHGYTPSALVGSWKWGNPNTEEGRAQLRALATAQSVYFVSLVVSQWYYFTLKINSHNFKLNFIPTHCKQAI